MAKKIAIVEDDPDQRGNYIDAITKKGYDVVAYSNRPVSYTHLTLPTKRIV